MFSRSVFKQFSRDFTINEMCDLQLCIKPTGFLVNFLSLKSVKTFIENSSITVAEELNRVFEKDNREQFYSKLGHISIYQWKDIRHTFEELVICISAVERDDRNSQVPWTFERQYPHFRLHLWKWLSRLSIILQAVRRLINLENWPKFIKKRSHGIHFFNYMNFSS